MVYFADYDKWMDEYPEVIERFRNRFPTETAILEKRDLFLSDWVMYDGWNVTDDELKAYRVLIPRVKRALRDAHKRGKEMMPQCMTKNFVNTA